jgi:hypothetical protein
MSAQQRWRYTGREGPLRRCDHHFQCVCCGNYRSQGTWSIGFEYEPQQVDNSNWARACEGCAPAVRSVVVQHVKAAMESREQSERELEAAAQAASELEAISSDEEAEDGTGAEEAEREQAQVPVVGCPAPLPRPSTLLSPTAQKALLLRRRDEVCSELPRALSSSTVQLPQGCTTTLDDFLDERFHGSIYKSRSPEQQASDIIRAATLDRYVFPSRRTCTFVNTVCNTKEASTDKLT